MSDPSCAANGDWDSEDDPCACDVHPRWCAWNGPCCDDCSHGAAEAHAERCGTAASPTCPSCRGAGGDSSGPCWDRRGGQLNPAYSSGRAAS